MIPDFKSSLIEHAKRAVAASARCTNEESAKMFLVLPFVQLLGYDPRDPHEVYPEHHADFSDKYKNKVDFAILKKDMPIIAIECKGVANSSKDDRGQLKSYFNAARTVKMGVLTDGLKWEFFADSDEPNLMDDAPFLTIDLMNIAQGKIDESALTGLVALHKDAFDPENIGAEARRKHVFNSVVQQIRGIVQQPNDEIARMLLAGAGLKHLRQKTVDEYREVIRAAFKEFIDQQILSRLDIQVTPPKPPQDTAPAIEQEGPGVTTTDRELEVFSWIQRRLAFLVKDATQFERVGDVRYRDYQGKFVIYYKQERKGRLCEFFDRGGNGAAGTFRFAFPQDVAGLPRELEVSKLSELDPSLLTVFQARVTTI